MSAQIVFELQGLKELKDKIKFVRSNVLRDVRDILNKNSHLLQTHIRQDLISFNPSLFTGGTSDNTLATRTGQLKRSIQVIPVKVDKGAGEVRTGLTFGTKYAKVHFGPKGRTMTMRPKNASYLTIPLPAAQGPHGQAKGGARDEALWGETFVLRNPKGQLIIYGQKVIQRGKHAGRVKDNIVPLFLLVKSVTVKTRIHPEDLVQWVRPKIVRDLREASKTWPA